MITIHSTLKPHDVEDSWHDRFETIQTNAVNSWKQLKDVEIVIFGNDKQTKDFCKRHNVRCSDIETAGKNNIPYLNKMFEKIETLSSNNIFLYISDDTIIFEDTIEVSKNLSVNSNEFCGCVQRYDAPVPHLLDFNSDWKTKCKNKKSLGHPSAGDYFLYSRGYWDDKMPSFCVGRAYYEHWMRWYASNIKKSLINVSEGVLTIHPNDHAHPHIKGSHDRIREWIKNMKESNEFKCNKELFSGPGNSINISNYKLFEFIRAESVKNRFKANKLNIF